MPKQSKHVVPGALSVLVLVAFSLGANSILNSAQSEPSLKTQEDGGEFKIENCKAAAAYNTANNGISLLVMKDDKIVFEDYPNGGAADKPYELASGTKSFTGIAAIAAEEDGILKLDEKVSETINEWKNDPQRSAITIRQLLTLTSGIKGTVGNCPTYAKALDAPISAAPGEKFQYGAEPFQIFGELMRRKLKKTNETELDYLTRRVLNPAGIKIARWRKGADGMPLMPAGAALNATEWAKFGQFVMHKGKFNGKQIIAPERFDVLFQGTKANPMYGLSWWLNKPIDPQLRSSIRILTVNADLNPEDGIGTDIAMAAGAGYQRLYLIPSKNMIVVRQASKIIDDLMGKSGRYSDSNFLHLVLYGTPSKNASVKSTGTGSQTSNSAPAGDRREQRRQRFREKMQERMKGGSMTNEQRQNLLERFRKLRGGQQAEGN